MKTIRTMARGAQAGQFWRNCSISLWPRFLARSRGVWPQLKSNHSLPWRSVLSARPGIRCVAIYWNQLCLTLNLFFLSYPIWNLTSWRSKGETTFNFCLAVDLRPTKLEWMPCATIVDQKNGAQAIPVKDLASRSGEGHPIQILNVATLQAMKNHLFSK